MKPSERIKHPCVNICNGWLRNDGICTWCGRDLEQVNKWPEYSETEKAKHIKTAEQRLNENSKGSPR